jgi:hypothetical protein
MVINVTLGPIVFIFMQSILMGLHYSPSGTLWIHDFIECAGYEITEVCKDKYNNDTTLELMEQQHELRDAAI